LPVCIISKGLVFPIIYVAANIDSDDASKVIV